MTDTTDTGQPDFFDKKLYQHDGFDKTVFRDPRNAKEVVRWMFKKYPNIIAMIDFDNVEVCEESYLDEELRESHVDVLYFIPLFSGLTLAMFLLVEAKTKSEPFTLYQMFRYVQRIWDKAYRSAKDAGTLATFVFPFVVPVIFYHGNRRFTAPTTLDKLQQIPEGLENYAIKWEAMLLDLSVLPESEKPEDLELSASFAAMQSVFEKDVDTRLLDIYRSLSPHFSNKNEDHFLDVWRRIFWYAITSSKRFTKKKCKETISEIHKIQGNDMPTMEKPIYLIDKLEARGEARGERRGIAIGLAEGEARGRAEGRARKVASLLDRRFDKVPYQLTEKLLMVTDLDKLDKLFDLAFDCLTLEEFDDALDEVY